MSERRTIRYNRSPESSAERSRAQRTRKLLPVEYECACGERFNPRIKNQRKCPGCITADYDKRSGAA